MRLSIYCLLPDKCEVGEVQKVPCIWVFSVLTWLSVPTFAHSFSPHLPYLQHGCHEQVDPLSPGEKQGTVLVLRGNSDPISQGSARWYFLVACLFIYLIIYFMVSNIFFKLWLPALLSILALPHFPTSAISSLPKPLTGLEQELIDVLLGGKHCLPDLLKLYGFCLGWNGLKRRKREGSSALWNSITC